MISGFFFLTFYLEIIVGSHGVVRNTAEITYTPHSVSPNGNISHNYSIVSQTRNIIPNANCNLKKFFLIKNIKENKAEKKNNIDLIWISIFTCTYFCI